MSVVSNSLSIRASMGWRLSKANTGLDATTQGPNGLSGTFAPATATFNRVYALASTNIAASGTQALNLNSFTDLLGVAVTATKACALLITATATVTGGILKIEEHGTNGLTWFFGGTTPSISLPVGTTGAGFLVWQGTTQTLSSSDAQLLLTNTGSQTITVTVSAVVGT